MNIARGNRVRPFVSLISLIFFIALLRTRTNWGSSSPATEESNVDHILGHETWQGTGRHVLGLYSPNTTAISGITNSTSSPRKITRPCTHVREHVGFPDECSYVRANTECRSGTVIEYIISYYCTFSRAPVLAYALFFVWLLMLFYMLGNTAADYFCCSLEKLSVSLRLPPTVAGVSLLPLGNGAPDVFASIASFLGTGHSQVNSHKFFPGASYGLLDLFFSSVKLCCKKSIFLQVGLNSVLGGAVFVTSVVAGSVSLAVQPAVQGATRPRLDFICFLRDVGFFMCSLAVLSFIIYEGKITFVGAVGYLSLYVLYGITVATYELIIQRHPKKRRQHHLEPLIPSKLTYLSPSDCGQLSKDCISDSHPGCLCNSKCRQPPSLCSNILINHAYSTRPLV